MALKRKKVKEGETKVLDATFLDKSNKLVNLKDIISEEDCWYVEKEGRHAMSHRAVKKLADIGGISKTYEVDESPNVIPSYKNELEHIVRVKIICLTKGGKKECIHGERTLTTTGESNRVNTPVLGRGYLRKMAEKRAYDLAVLEHLGLHTTTFSEDESEAMMGRKVGDANSIEIMSTDLEFLQADINTLLVSKTTKDLNKAIADIIQKREKKVYTPVQFSFLDRMMEDRKSTLNGGAKKGNELF